MSLLQNSNAVTPSAGYDIDNSCRFNDHTDSFLYEKINAAGSNPLIWTLSFWTKISRFALGSTSSSYPAGYRRFAATKKTSSAVNMEMGFRPADTFVWYFWVDGSNHYGIETLRAFRDPSAWYHFTVIHEATNSTAADRMQVWVNGERQTTSAYALGNPPTDGFTGWVSNGYTRMFGGSVANPDTPTVQYPYPGYMAEVNCVDGQALAPSNFGEADSDTNQWKAIEYAGTYGNNGFYFDFENSAALGTDTSGAGNNFTSSAGMDFRDQMMDSPQNSNGGNFCTMNPLNTNNNGSWNGYMQEGNLKLSGTAGIVKSKSTFPLDNVNGSYWEVYWGSATDCNCGISKIGNQRSLTTSSQIGADSYPETGYKGSTGVIDTNGSTEATYATAANGDIISFAYKAGRLYVGKIASGSAVPTWFNSGNPVAGTGYVNATVKPDPTEWLAAFGTSHRVNFGQDSSFAGGVTAQGNTDSNNNGDFYGTVPTGYLAMCTNNLADPLISGVDAPKNFNPVIYTGDGAVDHDITGVGFQPDFSWIKMRSSTGQHMLFDVIRGVGEYLVSNNTEEEKTDATSLLSFDSDGISVGSGYHVNSNTATFVNWNWKGGGAGVTNTDGNMSGTVTVSANSTAGFSIVKWTGSGATNTVGHGLAQAPELIIVKNYSTDVQNWGVGATVVYSGWTGRAGELNDTGAPSVSSNYWNDTPPTASVFTVSTENNVNKSGDNMIAYVFHSVEGYSKISKTNMNGIAEGAFLYCGFKPSYIMFKDVDSTGGYANWAILDNARMPINTTGAPYLRANDTTADVTSTPVPDFVSNGVKIRGTNGQWNDAGNYIWIAFAENPFKTSNAR